MSADAHKPTILHEYEGTAVMARPVISWDGKRITTVSRLCKVRCSCCRMALERRRFVADEEEEADGI